MTEQPTQPPSIQQFHERVGNDVLDKAFLIALEQGYHFDLQNEDMRGFTRFIVSLTLVHLGELGVEYDAHQLAESYLMRVWHFMQVADAEVESRMQEGGNP